MTAFRDGFFAFFRGIGFSLKHFRIWFLIPISIWLILSIAFSFGLSKLFVPYFLNLIESLTGLALSNQSEADSFDFSLKTGIYWGVIVFVKILLWYFISRYMKYLVLIILSPLFAYLSGKTEEIITGKSYPFNLAQFVKDVFRGIGITVRNMFIETMFMVTGGIIGIFVPFLSPFIILTLFLINSYFMAFNFFDYVVERKGLNISNSTRYMRSNKFTLLGFGFAYNIVSIIPMLDWVLAPISAATGSVIADSELPENLRSDSLKYLKT